MIITAYILALILEFQIMSAEIEYRTEDDPVKICQNKAMTEANYNRCE